MQKKIILICIRNIKYRINNPIDIISFIYNNNVFITYFLKNTRRQTYLEFQKTMKTEIMRK